MTDQVRKLMEVETIAYDCQHTNNLCNVLSCITKKCSKERLTYVYSVQIFACKVWHEQCQLQHKCEIRNGKTYFS